MNSTDLEENVVYSAYKVSRSDEELTVAIISFRRALCSLRDLRQTFGCRGEIETITVVYCWSLMMGFVGLVGGSYDDICTECT